MAREKQTKQIHQMTIAQFEAAFPNEEACDTYLVAHRWPNGVICPRCGSDRPYPLKTMKFKWECPDCSPGGYRFSNIAGTIFENTNVNLREWFRVIHMMLTIKKGVSARQVHRVMGFGSYKTAWYMCHRIRAALQDKEFKKLLGVVEVDQTFIGGLAKNKHKDKRGGGSGTGGSGSGSGSGKSVVVGAVQRKGNVVARVIENVRYYGANATSNLRHKKPRQTGVIWRGFLWGLNSAAKNGALQLYDDSPLSRNWAASALAELGHSQIQNRPLVSAIESPARRDKADGASFGWMHR
jgi:transposase-like protein